MNDAVIVSSSTVRSVSMKRATNHTSSVNNAAVAGTMMRGSHT